MYKNIICPVDEEKTHVMHFLITPTRTLSCHSLGNMTWVTDSQQELNLRVSFRSMSSSLRKTKGYVMTDSKPPAMLLAHRKPFNIK